MLSMDQINLIKSLSREGRSTREIAEQTGRNRETVMKYIKSPVQVPTKVKRTRASAIDAFMPHITNRLESELALRNRKHHLTAKRIHALIESGELTTDLPATILSLRTVERAVREIRQQLSINENAQHLKLAHEPGKAQLDFGEISLLKDGVELRHFLLVMTFPHSNYRIAQVLPAQNFECLSYGLIKMFSAIGRVPTTLRCDNMSTAVAKLIKREALSSGECNHDPLDHPRKLTDNFYALMITYGFEAEFCNPASGYEKGSVENAVGWIRRNFFCPIPAFNGDYASLNQTLLEACRNAADQPHYRVKEKSIKELFSEDLAVMHELPEKPFDACTWGECVVTNTCRVHVDTNEYQLDLAPKTRILVKKTWDRLFFMDAYGKAIAEFERVYGFKKDTIDWNVELKMLCRRPSAFNSSFFMNLLPENSRSYLKQLSAPKRGTVLTAFAQRYANSQDLEGEVLNLDAAVQLYSKLTVEDVVAGFRGATDIVPDAVEPLKGLPVKLAKTTLTQPSLASRLAQSWRVGYA